jgi:hypothetical protein
VQNGHLALGEALVPIWSDPNQCKSDLVRKLHAWWSSCRGPSGLPDRTDFDVFAHKPLLQNLMLSDVEPEPFRIRYRLVGTRIVRNLGVDFTGRYLDDLLGTDFTIPWMDYYRKVYSERVPLMGEVTEPTRSGSTFTYEFGIFPLTTEHGAEVKQFIALEDYFDFELTSGALAGLL